MTRLELELVYVSARMLYFSPARSRAVSALIHPGSEKSALMARSAAHAVLLHQTDSSQTEKRPAVREAAVLWHVVHTDDLL